MAILAAGVLTATSFNPAMIKAESVSAEEAGMAVPADAAGMSVPADAAGAAVSADEAGAAVSADEAGAVVAGDGSETAVYSEDGTPVKKTVKAADINMKVQDSYDFPFLGLKAVLPEELKKQIENSDMLMITEEEWNDDSTGFKYAFFHWNKLTEEQKNEDVNLLGTGYEDWLKSIERVGTLGVYSKDVIDDLDSITGCNEHKELGTSEDGNYKYYLSINKDAESDLTDEIEKIETTITEMTAFDPSKSVFDMPAENANPDAGNVGAFETTDIDGNAYTEKVFSDYDLTLVNCFTTWCSPCVIEMPDLDKLYQEMKEKRRLQAIISKIACSCIFLGCFCCIFLLISGKWIGIFLFKSPLAGSFILTLSWICPFLYTNTVLLGMINGLGKTTFSFIINFLSLCIRIAGVCLFIPIWGINGYLTGLLISQIFLFLCCILRLVIYIKNFS